MQILLNTEQVKGSGRCTSKTGKGARVKLFGSHACGDSGLKALFLEPVLRLKRAAIWSIAFILACHCLCEAQKTGVVLSGGGASGLCHVGVLKALEDHKIPIDYICGTSIGGVIAAYYAAGYTPAEIEKVVSNYLFQSITRGDLPVKYEFMVKKRQDFAAWLTLKYNFRSNYIKNLPTSLINSVAIDYYLMETFGPLSARLNGNFDSLMIPFLCTASDVENKRTVVFRKGDLPSALRAGMSYPFYVRPIAIDSMLLFDGGLYNNFPADIMLRTFKPDFIIGSDVAEKHHKAEEENLYQQVRTLMTRPAGYYPKADSGVVIEPWSDVGLFDFERAARLIDSGYASAVRAMPKIKRHIARGGDSAALNRSRKQMQSLRADGIVFNRVEVEGLTRRQSLFVKRSLFYREKPFTVAQLKRRFFRLAGDDKVKHIFPIVEKNTNDSGYTLRLRGRTEKPFYLEPGAIISNRPISEAFLGLQYNWLGNIGVSAYINGYIGKLTTGSFARIRLDFPGQLPFYIEPSASYSRWDYFSSSALFFDFLKPAYLIQEDRFAELKAGIPVGNFSQFNVAGGVTEWQNQYYQTDNFTRIDTADATYFDYLYLQANYQANTLNRKMYATEGFFLNARARYLQGHESYYPGTTSKDSVTFMNRDVNPWLQLKMTFDGYIKTFRRFKVGVFGEGVYSTQGLFSNYQASILSAPAFNPTPESQTFFIDAFRAHKYLAAGVKLVTSPWRSVDLRVEGYVFQPVESIRNVEGRAVLSAPFLYRHFSGMGAVVYNSPIGPFSIGLNYYDQYENPFSFFFHFGYIIFNRKSID